MMMEPICFLAGLISGLALWYYNDTKHNPYMKGYGDGYNDAFEFIKKELERRKVK